MTLRCATCGKDFDPKGWVSEGDGAVAYATAAGPVALCSTECERLWLEARRRKP